MKVSSDILVGLKSRVMNNLCLVMAGEGKVAQQHYAAVAAVAAAILERLLGPARSKTQFFVQPCEICDDTQDNQRDVTVAVSACASRSSSSLVLSLRSTRNLKTRFQNRCVPRN